MTTQTPLGAVLQPWRCAGTLHSGRPCEKLLAEVDYGRPIYVKVRCGRCGHENVLVERYVPEDARMSVKTV